MKTEQEASVGLLLQGDRRGTFPKPRAEWGATERVRSPRPDAPPQCLAQLQVARLGSGDLPTDGDNCMTETRYFTSILTLKDGKIWSKNKKVSVVIQLSFFQSWAYGNRVGLRRGGGRRPHNGHARWAGLPNREEKMRRHKKCQFYPLRILFLLTPVVPHVWKEIPPPALILASRAVWSLVTWISLSVNWAL